MRLECQLVEGVPPKTNKSQRELASYADFLVAHHAIFHVTQYFRTLLQEMANV